MLFLLLVTLRLLSSIPHPFVILNLIQYLTSLQAPIVVDAARLRVKLAMIIGS